jgi:hypothetical protein
VEEAEEAVLAAAVAAAGNAGNSIKIYFHRADGPLGELTSGILGITIVRACKALTISRHDWNA